MKMAHHIPTLDTVNYLGRYCYPEFAGTFGTSMWKRKIKAFRVRYFANGAAIPEVKVWHIFGYQWVPTRNIEFIWDYEEA